MWLCGGLLHNSWQEIRTRAFPVVMPSGQTYWTVLDNDLEVVPVADRWLRNLRFGRDRAELTTKSYAGGVALYLRWCQSTHREWTAAGRDLGLFMVWLKYTPAPRPDGAPVVQPGPGAKPVRGEWRINRVLVAVRGLLSYAVSVGEAPRSVLGQIYELADSRDLPAEAQGEDGGLFYRLRPVHSLREPETRVDRAGDTELVAMFGACHSARDRLVVLLGPVDVLKELMDHRAIHTTMGYYRVGEERRREAVDRVTALQFDRHGNRVWRTAQSLLDSEHVRRAIGEVAVPYGVCREPSNVAAGGHACPLRFRCLGCEHYSTDVSYLPDLQAHLADLLRSRERLMSAFEADDWARSQAMPSEEEIRRVRRLIERVRTDLDDLTSEDRAQIEQAVTLVRRSRTVMLGMPRVHQPLPGIRPRRIPT